jgi:hypothetical protein
MTSKPFYQYITIAAMSACIVAFAFAAVQLAEQFINLATGCAGGISRLLP